MKTTLNINDQLYRKAKVKAALEGRPLTELVQEGLRYVVEGEGAGKRVSETHVTLPLIPKGNKRLFDGMTSEEIHQRLHQLDSE